MTKEYKELLLKDLCARLPYGIKFKADNEEDIREIHYIKDENVYIRGYRNLPYWIDTIKPYLRPMSSMTEEEKTQYRKTQDKISVQWDDYGHSIGYVYANTFKTYDWFNEHHFDYRSLIPMGLALEAPEGMYK